MDREMIAFCGAYCGVCEWKDKIGCKGCRAQGGNIFWGECDKAKCCIEKQLEHCGECADVPCRMLRDLFQDPEHGDNGARLTNLRNWRAGNYVFEELHNVAQERLKQTKG